MKRLIATMILSVMVLGLVSISFSLPPPRWVLPPRRWVPPPVWRVPPSPPRPWLGPPAPPWAWPRPPLPWYWAPPPPAIRNWWFWVWWKPLPINVSYYPSERVYYYGYEPYSSYYEPESAEYPVYSEEYGKHPGISQISSPEDYERWLAETLNLTKEQQLAFFPKLRSLAQLREQYITTRASLSYEIAKLQQSHIASAQLDEKNKELEKVDTQFKKKERKLMNELMKILTAEQKTKFLAEMKHYTTESAVGEKKEKK